METPPLDPNDHLACGSLFCTTHMTSNVSLGRQLDKLDKPGATGGPLVSDPAYPRILLSGTLTIRPRNSAPTAHPSCRATSS